MICLTGNRPVLQVGNSQVIGYGTDWIETALLRAAKAADQEDFPFLEDILDGIVYYLENKCPLKLLPIEDLYARIRLMLEKIECSAIGKHLRILAPPVTLSLTQTARSTSAGFELEFFQKLRKEVATLHQLGTEEVRFTGLEEATLMLVGSKYWNKSCDHLQEEILNFLKETAEQNSTSESKLLLKLTSV